MGAAKVERSTSPVVACSISPSQASSTSPTADSTTSYYSPAMDTDPKDMPETAFVIAFCVKFQSAINNISFWPEDLDEAICCKEGPNTLIESLHKAFIYNLEGKKSRSSWIKRLAKLIDEWRDKGHDFFADHNPLERANYDYYGMSNRDKVMIMQVLVSWQLAESAEIKRIRKEHNEIVNDDDVRPLEVEVLGEDTSGSRYYYIGIGVRIYRESMISGRVKWETVSSTVDELKKFIFDYQGLDPNRSDQERVLYNKLVTTVLPYLEPLEMERKRLKEIKENNLHKVERDREFRLKKIEKNHNDSEILLVRTRSQAKRSVHKEVKNTSGYLEIIKNPTDQTISDDNNVIANTPIVDPDPSEDEVVVNINSNFKEPENPSTIQEVIESGNPVEEVINLPMSDDEEVFVTINNIIDSTTSSDIQSAEEDIEEDPLTKISNAADTKETAESKGLLEDVTVADTLDRAASEDMSNLDDKHSNKNEQTKKVAKTHRRDSSSSSLKMNLSSILTEEVSREAESVEQRSELSKMAISNILSSESSDVVHTDNKYFNEKEMDNGNGERVLVRESLVSYDFDTIVQKSNNNKEPIDDEDFLSVVAVVVEPMDPVESMEPMEPMEPIELIEPVEPIEPIESIEPMDPVEPDESQKVDNTPNISNDTIRTPWAPAVKKNQKENTAEVNDDVLNSLSETNIKRAFVPDAETMIKLEWSLNHPVFRLDEEVFGESTDTDLSDCCSDCAMEID